MLKNRIIFSANKDQIKVAFKDDTETDWYKTKNDAVKEIFKFFNEGKIEGEEYIKWLGLISGLKNASMGVLLTEEYAKETRQVGLSILYNLKVSFFAKCWSGNNIGYVQLKGGKAQSILITSKEQGRRTVWQLLKERRINSREVEKIINEIEESSLDEMDPEEDDFNIICNN